MFGHSVLNSLPDWVANPLRATAAEYVYFEDWFDIIFPLLENAISAQTLNLDTVPEIAYQLGIRKAHHPFNRAILKSVAFFEENAEQPWLTDLVIAMRMGNFKLAANISVDQGFSECHCHSGLDPNCPLQREIRAEICRRN